MAVSDDKGELLRAVPLFSGLEKKELKAVLRCAGEVTHEPDKQILGEGTPGVGFHLLLSGEAVVTQGGQELRKLGPGDYFGDISLLDGKPRSATVTAVGTVRTLSIAAWDFKPLLMEHPTIAIALLVELCSRLRQAEGSILR